MKDYIRTTIRGGVVLCVPPKDMEELRATISRLRSALTSIYLYQQDIGHPPLHSVAEGMRKMAHDALLATLRETK